jgi:hypothetical protein
MDRLRRELPVEVLHYQVSQRTRSKFLGRRSHGTQPQWMQAVRNS